MNPFDPSDPRYALWNSMQAGASAPAPVGALAPAQPALAYTAPNTDGNALRRNDEMPAGSTPMGKALAGSPAVGALNSFGAAAGRVGTSLASGHAAEDWADYSGNHGLSAVGALASIPDAAVNYAKFQNKVMSGGYENQSQGDGFVPGFDWNAAAKEGVPASMGVAGLMGGGGLARSAVKDTAGEIGIFGGRGALAQTPRDKLIADASESALAQGANAEEVRRTSGWFRGVDGQMRKEIPDENSRLKPAATQPGFTGKVGDAIDHPELFAAYPHLAEGYYSTVMPQGAEHMLGGMDPSTGAIYANVAHPEFTDPRGTLLHELQHRVQDRENFSPGANPDDFAHNLPAGALDARNAYDRAAGEVEARNVAIRADYGPTMRKAVRPGLSADVPEVGQFVLPPTIDGGGLVQGKFSKADEAAFRNYSGAHFGYVNGMLRDGEQSVRDNWVLGSDKIGMRQGAKTMGALETAFAKPDAVTSADQTVFRGLGGQPVPKVGDVVTDPAYMSTTSKRGLADQYAGPDGHTVELTVPAGKRGVTLGNMSNETTSGEMLLDKGSKYRVDSVDGKNVKATLLAGGAPVGAPGQQPAAKDAPSGALAPDLATYRTVPKEEADAIMAKIQAGGKLTGAERNAGVAYAFQNGQELPKDMRMRPEMTPSVKLRAAMNDPSSLPAPVPALGSKPAKRDATPEEAKDGGTVSPGRQPPRGAMAPQAAPAVAPQSDLAELAAIKRGDTKAVLAAQAAQNAPSAKATPGGALGPLTVTGAPPQAGSDAEMFQGLEGKYKLPAGYLGKIGAIESGNGRNMSTPLSSAKGYFQFTDGTAKAYGVDVNSTASGADGAARLAVANRNSLAKGLGVSPDQITGGQLYLAHQQGAAGALKILKNPDASMESLVGEKAAKANGGAGLTGGQFASKWGSMYDRSTMGNRGGMPNTSAPIGQGPGSGGAKGALAAGVTAPAPQLAGRPGANGQDGEDAPASKGGALAAMAGGGRGRSNPIQFAPAEKDHEADLSLAALIKRRGKVVKGAMAR